MKLVHKRKRHQGASEDPVRNSKKVEDKVLEDTEDMKGLVGYSEHRRLRRKIQKCGLWLSNCENLIGVGSSQV